MKRDMNNVMEKRLEGCEMAVSSSIGDLIKALHTLDDARRMCDRPKVKEVIYSAPVTAVVWTDGKVTRTRCQGDDEYDREKGLLYCLVKRAYPEWHDIMTSECWQ